MRIVYAHRADELEPSRLKGGFFEGWPKRPSAAAHLRILRGSDAMSLAIDADDGGVVVGFATAISDGVLSAYIPLLEVLPAYRGVGIGRELIERLLVELGPLSMVDAVCDEAVAPFYDRIGRRVGTGFVRLTGVARRDRGALPV